MKKLLSICIIIVGFLFAAGCIDYPDIVPEIPSDSIPVPTDLIPVPTDSIPVPTDSVLIPTDLTPIPTDLTPIPTDLTPIPTDSIPAPTDTIPVSDVADNRSGTPDFFIIYNWDSNNSHEVAIEIFNSDNESIFKELYIIDQNERINYRKTSMTTPYSQSYTFKVALDNETTDMIETGIDPWTTLTIFLYHKSPDYGTSGEIIPLEIFVADE